MTRARAQMAVGIVLLAAASACFPSFDFGGADSGSGADVSQPDASTSSDAPLDHTLPVPDAADGASGDDGSSPSEASPSDVAQPDTYVPPFDANTPPPDAGPYDAESTATIAHGAFALLVDRNGTTNDPVTATLTHDFEIDRYEVTVARFRGWVDAGMPAPGAGTLLDPNGAYTAMKWGTSAGSGTWSGYAQTHSFDTAAQCTGVDATDPQTYASSAAGKDDFPVTCVTWYAALAFCWWDGQKRLPTETEWRVVASGEGDGRLHPWGDAPVDCAHATASIGGNDCGWPIHVGAASAGVSKDGVFDLVGSAVEWVWDGAGDAQFPDAGVDYAPGQAASGDPTSAYVSSGYASDPSSEAMLPSQQLSTGSNYAGYAACGFRCARSK